MKTAKNSLTVSAGLLGVKLNKSQQELARHYDTKDNGVHGNGFIVMEDECSQVSEKTLREIGIMT